MATLDISWRRLDAAGITILDIDDAFVMNDGGTMRQVDASLLKVQII